MLDSLAEAWAATRRRKHLGGQDSQVPRSLHQVGRVPARDHEAPSRGLASEIPDLKARVDHILTKQVFGIGITRLTEPASSTKPLLLQAREGQILRRQRFSSTTRGNIWFERMKHTWTKRKCAYCGASEETFDRGAGRETHAYAFIHADDIKTRLVRIVWRRYAVRCHHRKPAISIGRWWLRHKCCAHLSFVRATSEGARTAVFVDGHSLSLVCGRKRVGRVSADDAN